MRSRSILFIYVGMELSMARNSTAIEDILYKCTIDEIRLWLISDLQENYKLRVNIHELLASMEEARWELDFVQLW